MEVYLLSSYREKLALLGKLKRIISKGKMTMVKPKTQTIEKDNFSLQLKKMCTDVLNGNCWNLKYDKELEINFGAGGFIRFQTSTSTTTFREDLNLTYQLGPQLALNHIYYSTKKGDLFKIDILEVIGKMGTKFKNNVKVKQVFENTPNSSLAGFTTQANKCYFLVGHGEDCNVFEDSDLGIKFFGSLIIKRSRVAPTITSVDHAGTFLVVAGNTSVEKKNTGQYVHVAIENFAYLFSRKGKRLGYFTLPQTPYRVSHSIAFSIKEYKLLLMVTENNMLNFVWLNTSKMFLITTIEIEPDISNGFIPLNQRFENEMNLVRGIFAIKMKSKLLRIIFKMEDSTCNVLDFS